LHRSFDRSGLPRTGIHPLTDARPSLACQHCRMTSKAAPTFSKSSSELSKKAPETSQSQRMYWAATGLFSAVFLGSALFGLLDLDASKAEWLRLEFPWWSFFFLTAGKVVGVAVIVSNRLPRVVKDFAFAGFLYDLLLAGGAHLAVPEVNVALPIIVLGIWGWAFVADSRRFPRDLRS
jgi:DoxX-like family